MSMLNFDSPAVSIFGVRRIPSLPDEDPGYSHYLERLPQEMFVHIIYMISLSDLGNLSLTGSPRLRDKIISWITSSSFQRKMSALLDVPATSLFTQQALDSWQQVSRDFGLLVKKVTMVHGSSFRLRLLADWYGRLDSLVRTPDQLWSKYLSRMGLASALGAFTKGWDVVEFHKILGWLRETEDHLGGDNRRLLRTYFWQFLESDHCKGTWTSWLINTFTKTRQPVSLEYQAARFLMCLFGPAQLHLKDEELLQLSVLQEQVLTKLMGKPDFDGLTEFQVSLINITSIRIYLLSVSV